MFAGVNSITAKQLNTCERECLGLLDYRLAILEEEYVDWRKNLQTIVTDSIKTLSSAQIPANTTPVTPTTARSVHSLLHPKICTKRMSPYQAPVSAGILAPAASSLWSPDSPLVLGGPLRPRRRGKLVDTGNSSDTGSVSAPPRSSSFNPNLGDTPDSDPMVTSDDEYEDLV